MLTATIGLIYPWPRFHDRVTFGHEKVDVIPLLVFLNQGLRELLLHQILCSVFHHFHVLLVLIGWTSNVCLNPRSTSEVNR